MVGWFFDIAEKQEYTDNTLYILTILRSGMFLKNNALLLKNGFPGATNNLRQRTSSENEQLFQLVKKNKKTLLNLEEQKNTETVIQGPCIVGLVRLQMFL